MPLTLDEQMDVRLYCCVLDFEAFIPSCSTQCEVTISSSFVVKNTPIAMLMPRSSSSNGWNELSVALDA